MPKPQPLGCLSDTVSFYQKVKKPSMEFEQFNSNECNSEYASCFYQDQYTLRNGVFS